MSYQLPTKTEKAGYVRTKFNKIAKRYDLFNDVVTQGMHRSWKNFVVGQALQEKPGKVLDLCCGTGDISQRLKAKIGENGLVIGLDFSSEMLKIAKNRDQQISGIRWIQGDAMNLPFPDASFDAITIGYGLRNLSDLSGGLKEMKRVLIPQGKLVCLEMGKVQSPFFRPLFLLYFFYIVPLIGKIFYPHEDMFDYLPHSTLDFPTPDELAQMMRELGFDQVRSFQFSLGATGIHVAQKSPD